MPTAIPPPTTDKVIPYSAVTALCEALGIDVDHVLWISLRPGRITAELSVPLGQGGFNELRERHPYMTLNGDSHRISGLAVWRIEEPPDA